MNWFRQALGVYFYGSLHIGLGAYAMITMTDFLLGHQLFFDITYTLAVFFGTVAFYAFHRIYDLEKISTVSRSWKYQTVKSVYNPIRHILFTALVLAAVLFFFLDFNTQLVLLVGSVFTIWYSLPFGLKQKKLREIPHIKIFVIALMWGLVTAGIPAFHAGLEFSNILLLFVERCIYIFALTLPFDVRDYLLDQKFNVKTIPAWLGKSFSLKLSVFMLVFIQTGLLCLLYIQGIYSMRIILLLIMTNLMTSAFVAFSAKVRKDLYFTGLLDGMLILQPLVLIIFGR